MFGYVSTGFKELDDLIGGYPCDGLTVFYGPASSGKTNLAFFSSVFSQSNSKKVLFLNTEGAASVERFNQIAVGKDRNNFIFFNLSDFAEQDRVIGEICSSSSGNFSMIVFDSVNKFFRTSSCFDDKFKFRDQLALLKDFSRKKKVPVLLSAQVYSSYGLEKNVIFAGNIINEFSDCLIELSLSGSFRKLSVKKHPDLEGEKELFFKIEKKGFSFIGF
jgi:RecA/RadA recombinase